MSILLELFHKIETEGKLPGAFSKAAVTLMSKAHKDPERKNNYKPFFLVYLLTIIRISETTTNI